MLGAIIGDIVGSRHEFNPTSDYNFQLFTPECGFTDDTVCTVAVADALLQGKDYGQSIHEWCRRYPFPMGGYGNRFAQWVRSDEPRPYGSYGNGSAMRVSPIGMWFSHEPERVKEEAAKSAACSHSHPEGIKGAQAVAQAVARAVRDCDGLLSDETLSTSAIALSTDILSEYDYPLDTDYENYRGEFNETCQGTVPPALDIVSKSTSFEDAIRTAVSLGADADTIGAIVGSIAEHVWGIPEDIKQQALACLPEEMRQVVEAFYQALEQKEEYKPEIKAIRRERTMMLWKLGAGNMGKFMAGENGMPSKEKRATEDMINGEPIPEDALEEVDIDIHLTAERMHVLMQGHIPDAMEDHWFMYCTEEHIRYYRSWSGMCAFEASFRQEGEQYVIHHLRINRQLQQFGVNGDAPAYALFMYLVLSDIENVHHESWLAFIKTWEETLKKNIDLAEAKKKEEETAKKLAEKEEARRQMHEQNEERKRAKRERREVLTWEAEPLLTCEVAGTRFIEHQQVFYTFGEDDILILQTENNPHDANAVALYFGEEKVGYIPRRQNADVARMLRAGLGDALVAYVSGWQGCGDKRRITVEVVLRSCREGMSLDFDDSPQWWAPRMVHMLDMGPRRNLIDIWTLWCQAYYVYGMRHHVVLDRAARFLDEVTECIFDLVKDRYTYDTRAGRCGEILFIRRKERCGWGFFCSEQSVLQRMLDAEQDMLVRENHGDDNPFACRETPTKVKVLEEDDVFVFGSNAAGNHNGGSALAALRHFGARMGEAEGLQGQSYAIISTEGLVTMARSVNRFVRFASEHPERRFLVTAIGCGVAGHTVEEVAPLFRQAIVLPNVCLPRAFWEYFQQTF